MGPHPVTFKMHARQKPRRSPCHIDTSAAPKRYLTLCSKSISLTGERPRIDESLHAYIIEKSNNGYIKDFFDRHGPYHAILFDWEDQDRQTAIETARQHRDILNALLQKKWRTARKALSDHIRWNHPILSKVVRDSVPT